MSTQNLIKGLHHVTATVSDAREDYQFYTQLLGQRLVKKTVNFDNNQVYHFYYGNETGDPGTIMTTFPYKGHGVRDGVKGTGQVAVTAFSAPLASIDFWKERLSTQGVSFIETSRFSDTVLQFDDPSGLELEIIFTDQDNRAPWTTEDISIDYAVRGINSVTLSIKEVGSTFDFLM
ncbi:MAG: VOC family protein, partial [Bacteroidota bacterium]